MPDIRIHQTTLAKVIKALGINAPVYAARRLKSGAIKITTRHGTQEWRPPPKKRSKPQ